jgi:hypothetical protein
MESLRIQELKSQLSHTLTELLTETIVKPVVNIKYYGIWLEEPENSEWLSSGGLIFSTPSYDVAKAQLQLCEIYGLEEQVFTLREF